ncbi:MAG: hypothetical protein IJL87_05510, partial [Clostridia bacterium]|nr:hypothetical protein [Clostridia bacterium]
GGCTPSDSSSLLRPPRETGDREGIREAIESWSGTKIVYKYPMGGEHRSAIIMNDLNGDGSQETVAFYKRADSDESIHVIMLKEHHGRWIVCNDLIGPGTGIDKVMFCNLDGEDGPEVAVSWSVFNNVQKTVRIYSFRNDSTFIEVDTSYVDPVQLNKHDVTYNEILCGDFDNDKKDELLTFVLASPTNQTLASANMVEYYINDETGDPFSTVTWTAALDNSIISYQKIRACRICDDTESDETAEEQQENSYNAVVVDGVNAQNMIVTDVVCWDNDTGSLCAPFYNFETGLSERFVRSVSVMSQDINGDGLVELPEAVIMPSYTAESVDPLYMLRWNRYVSDTGAHTEPMLNTVFYSDDGYFVTIPESWVGKITAKLDAANSTLYFYAFDEINNSFGNELFRIHSCSEDEFNSFEEQGFFRLATVGTKVYCSRLFETSFADGLIVSQDVVFSLFKLIEQ